MKKRQLIVLDKETEQLLHDIAMLEFGTAEHNLSKTIAASLKKMADDYVDELVKLKEMRDKKAKEMRKRHGDTETDTGMS